MAIGRCRVKKKLYKWHKKEQMLYSKTAIGVLSLLLSPFFGSFLFAVNLREIGKPSLGPVFIIGSLFIAGLIKRMLPDANALLIFALNNIIGSGLLYFYFFDKFFGEYDYVKKNFWPPTLFFTGMIAVLFLAVYFKTHFLTISPNSYTFTKII